MGIYLNPDNDGFWTAVRSEIYVDKTGLIEYTNKCINTEQMYICVSRPRRFGKSMALKMLSDSCRSRMMQSHSSIRKINFFCGTSAQRMMS